MSVRRMKPQDYRDYRLANLKFGTEGEVRAFIEARELAEKPEPKVWVRNPNWKRFDQMDWYTKGTDI
jgi:hypothetical protein